MALALIAEDDHFFSSLISLSMQQRGFEIITSFDGDETIELVRSRHPNILLLDLLMPKKDGYAVMEALRGSNDTAHMPILVTTNLSDRDSVERARKLGAADILIKADSTPEEIVKRAAALLPK